MGMLEERTVYALIGALSWIDYQDPGVVRAYTDGTATTFKQRDVDAIYIVYKGIFDS